MCQNCRNDYFSGISHAMFALPQYQKQCQMSDKTGTLKRSNGRHYHSSLPEDTDLLAPSRLCMSCIRRPFSLATLSQKMTILKANVEQGLTQMTVDTHVRNDWSCNKPFCPLAGHVLLLMEAEMVFQFDGDFGDPISSGWIGRWKIAGTVGLKIHKGVILCLVGGESHPSPPPTYSYWTRWDQDTNNPHRTSCVLVPRLFQQWSVSFVSSGVEMTPGPCWPTERVPLWKRTCIHYSSTVLDKHN